MDRLEALQAFVRLVEIESFTRVAAELRVTQPTISKWIAALEDEFGTQLIDRTTRTQRVTEDGERLYAEAKEILARYSAATTLLREGAPEPRGQLRVAVPVVFGRRHIVPLVGPLLRRFSELEVELAFHDRYVNLVEEGFDAAIRVGTPTDSTLRMRSLGSTPRHLVASPSYLKARGTPKTARDLAGHDCLLYTELSAQAWTVERRGKSKRVRTRGRIAANNSEALLAMACDGFGIAMLASWLVAEDLACKRLVQVLPDHTLPSAPIQALMPPGRYVQPKTRAFLDFVAENLELPGV